MRMAAKPGDAGTGTDELPLHDPGGGDLRREEADPAGSAPQALT
jgi:hypothetical protein